MAIDFNGSSDYLEVSLSLSYPITMACWFNGDTIAATGILVAATNSTGADDDRITLQAAGAAAGDPIRCGAVANGGTAQNASTTTGYSATTWVHACAVASSTTSRASFINGGSKGTNTSSVAMTGLNRLVIGAQRSAGIIGTYFDGRIAEVAVWNVALTDAEVAQAANGIEHASIRPDSLVFYAPLVRDVRDEIGGLTFTTSGTTVAAHPRIFK